MKIDMIWLLILLMCGSGAGIPAAWRSPAAPRRPLRQPAQPHQCPIESLKVEGNHNYTAAQILAVAGLKVGQMAGKSDFEAAHDRLVATGMFETVGYKFSPGGDQHGYAASFQVVEAQPAYPIRFDDLGATEKDLTEYLRGKDPLFAPRLAATKAVLERYRQWVQEYVTAHNGKDTVIAKVTPAGAPAAPGEFVILFRPARSDPAVAEVAFRRQPGDPHQRAAERHRRGGGGVALQRRGFPPVPGFEHSPAVRCARQGSRDVHQVDG